MMDPNVASDAQDAVASNNDRSWPKAIRQLAGEEGEKRKMFS